jgi:hypothetical protein
MRVFVSCLLLGVAVETAHAQTMLDTVGPELCVRLETDPDSVLADVGADDELLSQLIVTAILRQCAATGVIAPPEFPQSDETRSIDDPVDELQDEQAIMAAEADFYLSIAMGVDADAANDLLRRLLGSTPGTGSSSE